jgi:hypothetical protein
MSHGLVSRRLLRLQSGGYLLLDAAIEHEFRSPNVHGDDLGTGGLGGSGGIVLVIGCVTFRVTIADSYQ